METIYDFGKRCIAKAQKRGKQEVAKSYQTVLKHLQASSNNESLEFKDLTIDHLLVLQRYLIDKPKSCCTNTCLLYFRTLQTLHKQAAAEGLAPLPDKLYGDILKKETEPSVKRAMNSTMFKQVQDAVLTVKVQHLIFARDMLVLSFYLRGIPFIDLAYLRHTDVKNGILYYHRSKTGKSLVVTLEPCALEIINRYKNDPKQSVYLLPIIKQPGGNTNETRQYNSALRLYNKQLKQLKAFCQLPEEIKMTSYTPRHTWADPAHKDGVEIALISESLSHSNEKTTCHYLSSFTPDALSEVNQRVIDILNRRQHIRKEKPKRKHN